MAIYPIHLTGTRPDFFSRAIYRPLPIRLEHYQKNMRVLQIFQNVTIAMIFDKVSMIYTLLNA